MDQIPSRSLSKPALIVTPLFLIILAVLHTSSQLSYLFILKFINNVAGSADITFIPTMQPQISHSQFTLQNDLQNFGIGYVPNPNNLDLDIDLSPDLDYQKTIDSIDFEDIKTKIPLIDLKMLEKWANGYPGILRGVSPRWLVPVKIGTVDTVLIVIDVERQKNMGMLNNNTIPNLEKTQLAMQQLLSHKLGYKAGDVVPIKFKSSNLPNGLKLFSKFQSGGSDQQYKIQDQNFQEKQIADLLWKYMKGINIQGFDQEMFRKVFGLLYGSQVQVEYSLRSLYYPDGIYPSAISNVVIIQKEGFFRLVAQVLATSIIKINTQILQIESLLPPQYKFLWPRTLPQARTLIENSLPSQLGPFFNNFSMLSICTLHHREQIYNPSQPPLYREFTSMLENSPGTVEVIVIYPFFRDSLAIKYFFDSVIQIFMFVTAIVYFYTMTLVVKQIYQQKQIEVGIWRTLGAGAVVKKSNIKPDGHIVEVEMVEPGCDKKYRYRSQFEEDMSMLQKIRFYGQLLVKVGYIYYWLITTVISIALYSILKLILYWLITNKLSFNTMSQPIPILIYLFILIMIFILSLLYVHISKIYTNPLSQTIKPVKRTFDVVKVRVIHVATFGLSFEVLLVAVMLVYYGVVSYYWIPFSILDGQQDLQVLLFNTIFLFMIFGSIILLSISQSKAQTTIFSLVSKIWPKMQRMQTTVQKNIKSKKYKNIKVSIIISIIFAFVLFFTAGIKVQIQIIQSFIERALGAKLVFQNYQQNTFSNQEVEAVLGAKRGQGVQFAWLSRSLGRDNVSISFVSHITGRSIHPQFQVLTPSYLNSTFSNYYYPEQYLPEHTSYTTLRNKVYNGFNSIYTHSTHSNQNNSIGKYNPQDTITQIDPLGIVVQGGGDGGHSEDDDMGSRGGGRSGDQVAPEEQVVRVVVSSGLRKELGVQVGDQYKLRVANVANQKIYVMRALIVHSFKAGPGFDILGSKAFISQQQASYIYRILGLEPNLSKEHQKLFIDGPKQQLKGLGSAILPISPEHTQMFELQFINKSFSLLQTYLNAYIVLITAIMSSLVTIFIFLYTLNKCREEAEMYKMLRAIGLSASNIRLMVFSEIIIRVLVAIVGGIILGIVFGVGFGLQIEEFLMIKTESIDLKVVLCLAFVLIIVLSVTIRNATKYISQRSVAQTSKS